jgi:hypothetical protein
MVMAFVAAAIAMLIAIIPAGIVLPACTSPILSPCPRPNPPASRCPTC